MPTQIGLLSLPVAGKAAPGRLMASTSAHTLMPKAIRPRDSSSRFEAPKKSITA